MNAKFCLSGMNALILLALLNVPSSSSGDLERDAVLSGDHFDKRHLPAEGSRSQDSPITSLLKDFGKSKAGAPDTNDNEKEWPAWLRSNAISIYSLDSEDYSDLEPLKALLRDKRIILLGESTHGAAEFTALKVRLIRFLHKELGFGVVAFESGVFETNTLFSDRTATNPPSPIELMKKSIYPMWWSVQMLPLFEDISASILTLSGFDIQFSSPAQIKKRPQFLKDLISPVNPGYAAAAFDQDSSFLALYFRNDAWSDPWYSELSERQGEFTDNYEKLIRFLRDQERELSEISPRKKSAIALARQAAESAIELIRQILARDFKKSSLLRDEAMARNVIWLANDLYPREKIVIWAHNFHVRRKNSEITEYGFPTMGEFLRDYFGPQLYSIGLYMHHGRALGADGDVYEQPAPKPGMLESILHGADKKMFFIDLSRQVPIPGNSWMFSSRGSFTGPLTQNTHLPHAEELVHANQYDGILFVDSVSPSDLLR